jgi:hypothetical protein
MADMRDKRIREEAAKAFAEHQMQILANSDEVQMFRCQKSGTWCYGFQVVCADNMICLTGDIDSMLIEPGYRRNGTMFMRGSIDSESYFLSKIRHGRDDHKQFDKDEALSAIAYRRENYGDSPEVLEALKGIEEAVEDLIGKGAEHEFYRLWYEAGLDEAPSPTVLDAGAIYALEAMKWLARTLDLFDFKVGITPVGTYIPKKEAQ